MWYDQAMRTMNLIGCPYHEGRRDVGMGVGPTLLLADDRLRAEVAAHGWSPVGHVVSPPDERRPEVARSMDVVRRLAVLVRAAVSAGAFPLVLAGNCNSCLGTVAGAGSDALGVVWFDAHADLDTPDDNVSGYFDVMALAMLTGSGWPAQRAMVPGLTAIPERSVVLAGVRDLAPYQRDRLAASDVRVVPGDIRSEALTAALDELARRVDRIYLHVDVDTLDSGAGRANQFAAPGGPSLEGLRRAIAAAFARFTVAAAAITAYDPAHDVDGRIADAARAIAGDIARHAAAQAAAREQVTTEPIYHIALSRDWERAQAAGEYRVSTLGRTLEEEGFIHCSRAGQVEGVAARFYRGQADLVLLTIDPGRVRPQIRYETVPGADQPFPHVYGPLNVDAVVGAEPFDGGGERG
jgi:arginase